MIRITKIFNFESAHVLYGYDGKCKNLHGHSYKLFVTVKGEVLYELGAAKNGMVMDFGDLKTIVHQEIIQPWDHSVLINADSPHIELGKRLQEEGHQVVFCAYQPTCENMLNDIAKKISKHLPLGVTLEYLKLHETENSYGEWLASDQL